MGDTSPLVLLHGFAQNRDCWGPFANELDQSRSVARIDLPGHGAGGDARDGWGTADELVVALDGPDAAGSQALMPVDWLGYSLGGRMLLHLLLAHPHSVRRAVLIGATAGLAAPADRQARRLADDALADRIERGGIEAFLKRWMAKPMWAGLPDSAQFIEQRRNNTPAGLAGSLRLAGTGTQENLWPRLGEIDTPVLVVAGARDEKFTAIGQRLAADLSHGEFQAVPEAGHAAHLEAPGPTADLVAAWLDA